MPESTPINRPLQHPAASISATKIGFSYKNWLLGLVLAVATFVAYQPMWHAGFLWDDNALITENQIIKASDGLYRVWFARELPDYYPLTQSLWWLEWRWWGDQAVWYHVVNVLLHAVNAVLVWLVLRRLKIPGAWLAALVFALHPVNVATVGWISEQKNTLSMLFFALSIFSYLQFYEKDRWRWYVFSLVAFLLALLSKSAVVMLPFVLLGCVWWIQRKILAKDILRTLPFFVASLVLGLVTVWFQHRALGVSLIQKDGYLFRLASAGWVLWFYLYKAVLPFDLMVIYPKWPINASRWEAYVPTILLVVGFLILWRARRTWGRPLLFGLGYFAVMLFPVWGFFDQAFYRYSLVADHWQYYSIVGVISLGVGAGKEFGRRMNYSGRYWGSIAVMAAMAMLGAATWQRSCLYASAEALWQDNVTRNPKAWVAQLNLGDSLWRAGKTQETIVQYEQLLRIRPDDAMTHLNLGVALMKAGRPEDAIRHYERTVEIDPNFMEAHYDLGIALLESGRFQEAAGHWEQVLRLQPDYAEAHYSLGLALVKLGRVEEAIGHFTQALQLNPGDARAHFNLGNALLQVNRVQEGIEEYKQALKINPNYVEPHINLGIALLLSGRFLEAAGHWEQVLRLQPDNAEAHYKLGFCLEKTGKVREGIAQYEEALRLKPDLTAAQNDLAWSLATHTPAEGGDPVRAVMLAQEVCARGGNNMPTYLDTLASAYAAAGQFDKAIATAQKAIELARAAEQPRLVHKIETRLNLYRGGRAYSESAIAMSPSTQASQN